MMEKILTVVVPTYNAEKYLRDNLESFCIEELLPDLDILVINDGSTDASLEIAQEYTMRYPDTYRVITKENGGHGSGINWGIRYALGKYFKVVDADDWVEREAFVELIQALKREVADIVYSGFLWVFDEGQTSRGEFRKKAEFREPFVGVEYQKVYTFDEIANHLYIKMHNMTIRTELLRKNHRPIDEHCFYVDLEYIAYPIPYVYTICFLSGFVYMYRIGTAGQSISVAKLQKNKCHYDVVIQSLLEFYEMLGKKIDCVGEKKQYLAGIIARAVAGKYKIILSAPASIEKKRELETFDCLLLNKYPEIYRANRNKAVAVLRQSGYKLYWPACRLVKWRNRRGY